MMKESANSGWKTDQQQATRQATSVDDANVSVTPHYPVRFNILEDQAGFLQHLDTHGYAVVANVIGTQVGCSRDSTFLLDPM